MFVGSWAWLGLFFRKASNWTVILPHNVVAVEDGRVLLYHHAHDSVVVVVVVVLDDDDDVVVGATVPRYDSFGNTRVVVDDVADGEFPIVSVDLHIALDDVVGDKREVAAAAAAVVVAEDKGGNCRPMPIPILPSWIEGANA